MVDHGSKKSPKVAEHFHCELCDYITCKSNDYKKHLATDKHQKRENGSKMVVNGSKKSPKVAESEMYQCHCGRTYRHNSGYYRHKKTCDYTDHLSNTSSPATVSSSGINKDELILQLLKQNAKLMELIENGTHNTIHQTHTNSHNKSFNLNVFLNETCKNAMNITEFIESIKLQLSDLMELGKVGYVKGISKIIASNLSNLDENIRPIHCTDKKRETFYVKDENKWAKEEGEKPRIKRAIRTIADKNIRLLPQFRQEFPEYKDSASHLSDTYDKMVYEAMGGIDGDSHETHEKIIRHISKVTSISGKFT